MLKGLTLSRQNRSIFRFCLLFIVYFGIFCIVFHLHPVQEKILRPYAVLTAQITGWILQGFMSGTRVLENVVFQPRGFAMIITVKCLGLLLAGFLIAVILASPSSMRKKIIGIILGTGIIFMVNLLRLISLFVVGTYASGSIDFVHDILWEGIMIVLTFGIWMKWRKMK
ncbi:MAG: archaeosortase/exosortase family protein [Candidatus Aminicenantes bacterium]|nr:MAG: archaeosortase/exosortase family protein [Candidatus Aminicenantes bacterium]